MHYIWYKLYFVLHITVCILCYLCCYIVYIHGLLCPMLCILCIIVIFLKIYSLVYVGPPKKIWENAHTHTQNPRLWLSRTLSRCPTVLATSKHKVYCKEKLTMWFHVFIYWFLFRVQVLGFRFVDFIFIFKVQINIDLVGSCLYCLIWHIPKILCWKIYLHLSAMNTANSWFHILCHLL